MSKVNPNSKEQAKLNAENASNKSLPNLDETQKSKILKVFQLGFLTLVMIVSTLAVTYSFLLPKSWRHTDSILIQLLRDQQENAKKLVEFDERKRSFENHLNSITKSLGELPVGASDPATKVRLDNVENSVKELSDKILRIETAILGDPAKAIEIPLLRKDIDTLQTSQNAASTALKEEMSRAFDLNKWFLGLMGTMSLGVLGLAVTTFLKAADKKL